jgi:hypothetical protein
MRRPASLSRIDAMRARVGQHRRRLPPGSITPSERFLCPHQYSVAALLTRSIARRWQSEALPIGGEVHDKISVRKSRCPHYATVAPKPAVSDKSLPDETCQGLLKIEIFHIQVGYRSFQFWGRHSSFFWDQFSSENLQLAPILDFSGQFRADLRAPSAPRWDA